MAAGPIEPEHDETAPADTSRVLIIDDERDFALSLADILEAHGYEPVLAHDAAAAEAHQAELAAPVALIDVRLAEGSGLTLLTSLRARCPRMLSVMMTAYADVDSAVLALQKGAYDFLRKPFEAGDVLAVLERCFAHVRLDQERRAAEKALYARSEELAEVNARLARLATAVEHADEDIMITDARGAIEYVNPAFERITGYARDEVLGKTPRVLKSGVHGTDFYSNLWRTLTDGRTWQGRFTNRQKDGALILEDASISPILDQGGSVLGYVSVKRDATQQVHLERHLVEAQKMDALGTLAGGIAHDFNNLLSAILGSAELGLRAAELDSKPARHLGNIRRAASRAAELTRQILAFSRRAPQESRPTDLRAVVDEALSLLRASLPATVKIRRLLVAERAVQADATQIHQVLMNLGANAGLAMRESGGVLEVNLEDVAVGAELADQTPGLVPGPYVRLTVRDTGQGMSPDILARAFEPFYTTRPQGEGTGMGLAVVHGIVRNHGGTVHVTSSPGAGATFTIHLPALEPAEAAAAPAVERPPRGTERVLLVDDEEFHREVTQEMLLELGYRVTCCADGREALERIGSAPSGFDIVLSDVTMPRLTGDALLRELRRLEVHLPVVLCTGFADRWTLEGARAQGAQGLLLKPVALWDLAIAIRKALADKVTPRS